MSPMTCSSALCDNFQISTKTNSPKTLSNSPSLGKPVLAWPWQNPLSHGDNDKVAAVSVLNALDVISTISAHFVCRICHSFMIDTCSFPCGHLFCKYCGISWLRLDTSCPVCNQQTFRPFATRCYEMDSVIDDFYPLLFQFYRDLQKSQGVPGSVQVAIKVPGTIEHDANNGTSLSEREALESNYVESIEQLVRQRDSPISLRLHSIQDREKLRQVRRTVTDRKDVLFAAPCTSILQKIANLNWEQDDRLVNCITQGFVWMILCYCFYNLTFVFQHPLFDGIRCFVYSAVILVSLNLIQKQLFVNPADAPDLLDFELWEYRTDGGGRGDGEPRINSIFPFSFRSNSQVSATASSSSSSLRNPSSGSGSSNVNFNECQEDCSSSFSELEQILQWKKEGKLNLKEMFTIADGLVQALHSLRLKDEHDDILTDEIV